MAVKPSAPLLWLGSLVTFVTLTGGSVLAALVGGFPLFSAEGVDEKIAAALAAALVALPASARRCLRRADSLSSSRRKSATQDTTTERNASLVRNDLLRQHARPR